MSVLDVVRPGRNEKPDQIPDDIRTKVRRGRQEMLRDAPMRRLCQKFEKGDSYFFVNVRNLLDQQITAPGANGQGKPPHRIRNSYNFIRPIVAGKTSAASQRVPGYEILPSNTDSKALAGAALSQKVALYGYDKWRVRSVKVRCISLAIGGGGEGFAQPYFDPNVGPYLNPPIDPETGLPDGPPIGQGEIKTRVFSGNEVGWEPGVEFEDSPWYFTESAEPVDSINKFPGFFGKPITPDAAASDVPRDRRNSDGLAMVTRLYERPCPDYPDGRLFTIANNRVVVNYQLIDPDATTVWEPYPLIDTDGTVLDEPVLHRLAWSTNTDGTRDLGLTRQLLDLQRTIQDCWNKLLEIKNRALKLQMLAPNGANVAATADEPGAILYYDPVFGGTQALKPEWEDASNAIAMARTLFDMLEKAQSDMRELGFDTQLSADPNVAAKTVNAVIEQFQAKWQTFLGDVADWDSRLMRHYLLLVARHYSEGRKLTIRGVFGAQPISDFDGSQLMGQVNVRVLPGSLEYLTRDQVTQRVFAYADRQWISPQQAMRAISAGTDDILTQSLNLNYERVDSVIQKIIDGTVLEMPPRETEVPMLDATGQTVMQMQQVPGWMPMDHGVDDLSVWRAQMGDFMKTDVYARLPVELQEVPQSIMNSIDDLERIQAQRVAVQQQAQAEALGMANAASPQKASAPGDMPQPAGEQPAGPPTPQ